LLCCTTQFWHRDDVVGLAARPEGHTRRREFITILGGRRRGRSRGARHSGNLFVIPLGLDLLLLLDSHLISHF
jgi:hypothetical protein